MSCERRSCSIQYMYQHALSHVKSSTTRVMDCGLSGSDHSRIHGDDAAVIHWSATEEQ